MNILSEYNIFDLKEYNEYVGGEDDQLAISIAMNVARRLLREPKVTADQIVGIGHALYALQRLPVVTPGVNVSFGIVTHFISETTSPRNSEETITLNNLVYTDFHISEDKFEISRGGSDDCGAGHDSYSLPGWFVGLNGDRRTNCDLQLTEERIMFYLEREKTDISVENQSCIDFFDSEETLPLNYHELNQKAKKLLQQSDNNLSEEQLYILELIEFGLKSPQMEEKRKEIRSADVMQKLEEKVTNLRKDMIPIEVMTFLLQDSSLVSVLETDDLIEGSIASLWLVIDQMISGYEENQNCY